MHCSQIPIKVRTWCLLSSQKCSSHFIGIGNCDFYFSESVLSQDFYCWWILLQAPQTRLRRLVNVNKQKLRENFSEKIGLEKWKEHFPRWMKWFEHFCDDSWDQNTSYITIWKKIKKKQTFYWSALLNKKIISVCRLLIARSLRPWESSWELRIRENNNKWKPQSVKVSSLWRQSNCRSQMSYKR